MSAYAVLREKPIWVGSIGIRKVFWSPVQDIRQFRYVSASSIDVITYTKKENTADSTSGIRDPSY